MKIRISVAVSIISILFLVIGIVTIRSSNERELEEKIGNPEYIFNGVFDTEPDNQTNNGLNDTEISVCFDNENNGYDGKDKSYDGKTGRQMFNAYFIKMPGEDFFDKNTGELTTTWFLCKYDYNNNLILLNQHNQEIGKITYELGTADWSGKREVKYYWSREGECIPIYKSIDFYYSLGEAHLESKYYSGPF